MPTLLIYWKAKDMAAFVAAYLYYEFFQKTQKVVAKACDSLDGIQWTSDSTIVLGFPDPPVPSANFLSVSNICLIDVYNSIHENDPVPDWVWLIHRLTTEPNRVYFDRLMETMLRPLTQATHFSSFHSFLQRYNSPLSMLDLIQEAEQLEINRVEE